MDSFELEKSIDTVIPNAKVSKDIFAYLKQEGDTLHVEIDQEYTFVPRDVHMDIVNKIYIKEYYDICFGTGYRVQVAIGGVKQQKHGILYAQYGFATLYYDAQGEVITIDFHKEMR